MIKTFLIEIASQNRDYSSWGNAKLVFVNSLYSATTDFEVAGLYHLVNGDNYLGYVILGSNSVVLEFTKGPDPYIEFRQNSSNATKFLYDNAMPSVLIEDTLIEPNIYGRSLIYTCAQPNEQSGNCIAGAISNLIWHHDINSFPNLVLTGKYFVWVEQQIDSLILA